MIVCKWMDGSMTMTMSWPALLRMMAKIGTYNYQYCYCCINDYDRVEKESEVKLQSVWVLNETPGSKREVKL